MMVCKIDKQTACCVIGHGSWATALVKILLWNNNRVFWYIRNPDVLESVIQTGHNSKYLTDVILQNDNLTPTSDIDLAVSSSGVIVLAAPSAFLKTTLEPLTVSLKDKFIVSAIKGIITPELVTVAEYMHAHYGLPFAQLGIVTGPCHAEEVALDRLSYLTVVCKDEINARTLSEMISSDIIKTTVSTDIYGTEYAALLKNIYAIAVGIAVGAGYGDNFNAVLISNAAIEINRFLKLTFPAERDTNASAYLGDLLVTCYSQFSRNRSFGVMIGKGYSVQTIKMEMNMIAEGYYASDCIAQINTRHGVDLPIAECVHKILYQGVKPKVAIKELTLKLI